jgi:hypothetical protein
VKVKVDQDVAIKDESSDFAATGVIGRWPDRFGVTLSSANLRLMFDFDERMLAANLSQSEVIVTLDQREFRKRAQEGTSLHTGWVFQSLGTWNLSRRGLWLRTSLERKSCSRDWMHWCEGRAPGAALVPFSPSSLGTSAVCCMAMQDTHIASHHFRHRFLQLHCAPHMLVPISPHMAPAWSIRLARRVLPAPPL